MEEKKNINELRDQIAIEAMQSIIEKSDFGFNAYAVFNDDKAGRMQSIAKASYLMAEEMLKEREKQVKVE